MSILGLREAEESAALLCSTILIAAVFFNHAAIDGPNTPAMVFELMAAGIIGFVLARYYFNKERGLRAREKLQQDFAKKGTKTASGAIFQSG